MVRGFVFTALILLFVQSFAQDTGARYLIITHDDYYDILKPLAQ